MKLSKMHVVACAAAGALMVGLAACGSSKTSKANVITIADTPIGWASYAKDTDLAGGKVTPPSAEKGTIGGFGGQIVTVKTRDDFIKYAESEEPMVIFVDGTIDMTDLGNGSMIPETVTGSTFALDKWIADRTAGTGMAVTSYHDWKVKYTASQDGHFDESGEAAEVRAKMDKEWAELIDVNINSNKTIIGLGANSGLFGGSLFIKNKENVIIRNMNITECYNPFPEVEANDGLNAEWDTITVRTSKYIWIDHCTISSKFSPNDIEKDKFKSKDGEMMKWQVHDGLLDITNESDFVTVSWCILRNHDKTQLIGSSDKKTGDANHQTISLIHNWYDGCGQRLPMVRFATLHIANNYYSAGAENTWQRGIDRRKDCKIYSEGNYFEEERKSVTSRSDGNMYDVGSVNLMRNWLNDKPAWNPRDYYDYTAVKATEAKNQALTLSGAGKIPVIYADPAAINDPK